MEDVAARYHPPDTEAEEEEDLETNTITTTTCNHVFHKGCVDRWFSTGKDTCPVCRCPQPRSLLPPMVDVGGSESESESESESDGDSEYAETAVVVITAATAVDAAVAATGSDADSDMSDRWFDHQSLLTMNANLTPDQVNHVLEVATIYNIPFYPLTRSAYHNGEWMPEILRNAA